MVHYPARADASARSGTPMITITCSIRKLVLARATGSSLSVIRPIFSDETPLFYHEEHRRQYAVTTEGEREELIAIRRASDINESVEQVRTTLLESSAVSSKTAQAMCDFLRDYLMTQPSQQPGLIASLLRNDDSRREENWFAFVNFYEDQDDNEWLCDHVFPLLRMGEIKDMEGKSVTPAYAVNAIKTKQFCFQDDNEVVKWQITKESLRL